MKYNPINHRNVGATLAVAQNTVAHVITQNDAMDVGAGLAPASNTDVHNNTAGVKLSMTNRAVDDTTVANRAGASPARTDDCGIVDDMTTTRRATARVAPTNVTTYNPTIHHRHSIRLKSSAYRLPPVFNFQAGLYWVMKEEIEKIEGK